MTNSPPQSFRNACSIEISCDEDGRDCQLIASCDLVHRQTGQVHSFKRVIDLQPILAMIHRGFHERRTLISGDHRSGGGSGTTSVQTPFGTMHVPKPPPPPSYRGSRGAQDAAKNTVSPGSKGQRLAGPQTPRDVYKTDEQLAQEAQDAQDAQDAKDQARQDQLDDRDYKRQQTLEDRAIARQDAQDKRDAAYEAAHPDRDDDQDNVQDDDVSGSIARRIAASKGVADLWSQAHPLIVGGWFDDLRGVANRYASDIKQGAVAAATAIGGPVAGKLASACVDAIAGDPRAQTVVAHATAIARQTGNPDQANVVAIAKQSANQATLAYHAADAASAAKAGDPQARAFVAEVHTEAASGNPDAQTASKIARRVEAREGSSYSGAILSLAMGSR